MSVRRLQLPAPWGDVIFKERIAAGGMAEVFVAENATGRKVAIKQMLSKLSGDEQARRWFSDEYRFTRASAHPNVIAAIDEGVSDAVPWIALEYIDGPDVWRIFRTKLRQGKALPVEIAVSIIDGLCAALTAVHRAVDEQGQPLGLVHQDVSPSNVLIDHNGVVKLIDFGISKVTQNEDPSRSSERAKGKLGYISPEQVEGRPADQRSDIYSAGVILAELIIGQPLFSGPSDVDTLVAIRDGKIDALLGVITGFPESLGRALLYALERDPKRRTRTVDEFRQPLSSLLPPDPVSALRDLVAAYRARNPSISSMNAPKSSEATPVLDAPTSPRADVRSQVSTADSPMVEYKVIGSGKTYSYAAAVEAMAIGELHTSELLVVGSDPPRGLREFPELRRHAAQPDPAASPGEESDRIVVQPNLLGIGGYLAKMLEERLTGLVVCTSGTVRKEIFLEEGTPVFVSSNLSSELFGEFLVREKVIRRSELDMALAVLHRFDGRMGDTLVALGLVSPMVLVGWIARQVQYKLAEVFTWTQAEVSVFRGAKKPAHAFPLGIDPWPLLSAGFAERARVLGPELFTSAFRTGLITALRMPLELPLPETAFDKLAKLLNSPMNGQALLGEEKTTDLRDVLLLIACGAAKCDSL